MPKRRVTYWILLGTKLRPEVTLVSEVESRGNAIVRLLKGNDLEPADVIHAMKFVCGTGSERSTPNTNLAHLLDNVREDVLKVQSANGCRSQLAKHAYLDGSEGRPGELKCPLDLEPM